MNKLKKTRKTIFLTNLCLCLAAAFVLAAPAFAGEETVSEDIFPVDDDFAVSQDMTVPSHAVWIVSGGVTLTVEEEKTLTVSKDANLIVAKNATLAISKGGTLNNEGKIVNNGKIVNDGKLKSNGGTIEGDGEIENNGEDEDEEKEESEDEKQLRKLNEASGCNANANAGSATIWVWALACLLLRRTVRAS
jgi:hypothetical protein